MVESIKLATGFEIGGIATGITAVASEPVPITGGGTPIMDTPIGTVGGTIGGTVTGTAGTAGSTTSTVDLGPIVDKTATTGTVTMGTTESAAIPQTAIPSEPQKTNWVKLVGIAAALMAVGYGIYWAYTKYVANK